MKMDLKADLDAIIINEIGQFGKFQRRMLSLAIIASIFSAFQAEYLFTTARIGTRCLIPECEDANQTEFAPEWILNAVPGDSATSFDNCRRFGSVSTSEPATIPGTCPETLFNTSIVVPCENYVYENTQTVVFDFDLGCDEWHRSLIGFVRTFGTLAALPITGYISDRWGRRTALTINAFNAAWLGLARYGAGTYVGFMISKFVEATFGAGVFSCIYILVLELVGPEYRVIAGGILSSSFALGQVIMGLIAWAVSNWRPFILAIYIPQIFTISYIWLMSESVRWYMSKGRYEESEALLKEAALANGKELSQKSLEALRLTAEEEKRKALEDAQNLNEPWLIVLVFRHKQILIRCMVLPIWWITTTLIYYGLSINAVNMSGNSYVKYIAVSAVEIPGFWIAVILLGKIGRRFVLMVAFWLCAACQIAYIYMPDDLYGVSLMVYLIGKSSISTVVIAIYIYTAELYPTKYRHNLFAFSSMMGRIGSIIAPLTPAIGATTFKELPFMLFGGFALLSGLLTFTTPETLGTKLPDTMEEASRIGHEQDRSSNI